MRLGSRVLSFLLMLFVLVAVSTTTLFASMHTTASPKARVTSKVDDSKRTTLHGHVPAVARKGMDLGRVEPSTPVEHLIMMLKSDEDQKREIRRIIDEQQDKHTKNYHQWTTPEEFGEHFGVHDSDIAQITAWLGSHGLSVESVNKSKRVLHFSGTVGQLEGAFHTQMHYLLMPNGETHVSNDRDISVPTALKDVIAAVPTLNDFFRKSHKVDGTPVPIGRNSRMKPGPRFTSSSSAHLVSAGDFATIYNTAPLLAQGINGSGIKIGIVGRSDILLDDVETYRAVSGLPANDPVFIHAGQDAGTLPGDDSESDLDVEISGGVAPNATVDFVIGTPTFLVDGITNSFEYLIENNLTDIISSSYGDCEANEGAGGNLFNAQLFEQAAAQGISVFIAEGDNGPAGCDAQGSQTYEVLGYASGAEEATWYSVGVGGTEFYGDGGSNYATYWNSSNASNESSAIKYIPEYPWNEAGVASPTPSGEASADFTDLWSASGAVSAYYLRPPWQTGSGINNSSDPAMTLANGAAGNWVASVNITNPGNGYTTAPSVTFGSGCTDAPAATSVLGTGATAGQVVGLTFTGYTSHYQGFNCTSTPTVTFGAAPGGGANTATGTAVLGPMQNLLPLISGVPHRLTPDVSLNASSGHDGTIYCDEGICDEGYLDAVGGTSVAAPSMAGVQALIDQANGGRQGMPAYIYYALANAQNATNCNSSSNPVNGSNCAFQDVTLGNNYICGQGAYSGKSAVCSASATSAKIGFAAGTGFDLASGLGSPNVANLASQWSSVVFNSSNTTLGLSNTSFTHGTSITLSGTVAAGAGGGTPTGDVAFIVTSGAIGDTNNETTGAQNGPVAFATLSGGSYSATLNNLPGGTYYVTARYGGDETFASSLSAGTQVTVSPEAGAVTITPYALSGSACTITSSSSFTYGQDTLININVAGTSGNGAPTGTVALTLDGNPWTTVTLDPNGNAFAYSGATTADTSCVYDYAFPSVNMIAAGSHTIGATYSGDSSVATATATPASITVAQISPGTLTFDAGGGTTAVIASGATIPLAVIFPTVSSLTTFEPTPGASGPTGTITFTDTTTSTVLGTATVVPRLVFENQGSSTSNVPEWIYSAAAVGSTNGITTSGANTITATYSGDTNYTSATATATVTVGGTTATTVAVTSSANPTTLGGVPTFTATVTTATAGTVTFFDGTTVLGQGGTFSTSAHTSTYKISATYPFVGGAHSITATYSGTGTTSQSSTSPVFTENVTQGTMTIILSSKATDVSTNTFSLTAVLNCLSGGCGTNPFLGTASTFSNVYAPVLSSVQFYDGATLLGSAPATEVTYAQGGASIWTAQFNTTLSGGSHSITATYSDTNYAHATSSALAINATGAQTITFGTPAPSSAGDGSSFTVAATASSSLAVAYTSFGSCTNSGATYTMTKGTGTCLVIANQAGNSSYGPAPEVTEAVAAFPGNQTITFGTPAPASAEYGSSFTVAATASSGLAVTYTSDGVVCTNVGAVYTMIASSGNCSVIANQAGNANWNAAPTVTETTSATDANGSVSVASGGPNPSTYGQSVTFTATIGSDTGQVKGRKGAAGKKPMNVTGTVTWSGNTGCAPSTVTGGYPGTASCTTSSLGGGSDTVTANYGGDSNHNPASGSVVQTVNTASTTTAVSSSLNPSEFGQAVSFSATVTGSSPTGTVQFYVDSVLFDTETLVSGSATSISTSTLAQGTHTVSATYSGDTDNSGSSGTLAGGQVVNQSNSTTTVTSTPNPSTYAQQVTFTATITTDTGDVKGRKPGKSGIRPMQPTGTVTWSANTGCSPSTLSGAYPGVATCTTSSASHLPVGTDAVSASYSGDSNHTASSGSVNQVVQGGIATTIDVTNVSPASEETGADSPITITAVLAWTGHGVAPTAANVTIGGNGNGTYGATGCAARVRETITCTAIYTPTNADGAGTYTETATFSGDANYSASTSPETGNFTLTGANSTTTVTSGLNPSTYGGSVTFTATITTDTGDVKGRKPGKNGIRPMQPTGTVTWSANTGCAPSTLTGTYPGVATCTTSSLGGGSDTVAATYPGDANHTGSSGSVNQTVYPASQTITFTTAAPSSAAYNSTFGVAASASSSLTVAFTAAGSCSVADNGNGTATYTMTSGAGTCTVKANQAGNANYSAAAQATESVSATPASQTIVVTTPAPASAAKTFSFTVVASATSGLPITFTSSGICTNVQGTYTMTSNSGTCTVKMNAPSSANYTAAPQVIETTAGAPAVAPTVSLTGEPATANAGATFLMTASSTETGAVSIPVISTTTPAVCSVGAGTTSGSSVSATVTMLTGTGTCDLKAAWAANYAYKAATVEEHTIGAKIVPTVTFTGAPSSESNGSSFTVTATSNESGIVSIPTITTTTGTACTVGAVTNNGPGSYQATVTISKATGTCTTKAAWAMNPDYDAASALQHTANTH